MDSGTRLERALAVFLDWQNQTPQPPFADLVAAHEDLAEYLESLHEDPADAEDLESAETIGGFTIVRELGRGGMGIVYEARQLSLGRSVALKVLAPHLASNATSLARFQREATTAGRLKHPGIVGVLGFGEDGDTRFLAMELIEGAPLDRVIKELAGGPHDGLNGPTLRTAVKAHQLVPSHKRSCETDASSSSNWNWHGSYTEKALGIVIQIAHALDYAHEHGVIHRDVKPSNILICESGRAVLTDFGLAREIDVPSITVTGEFAGTPYYVSPEQVRADPSKIDERTDIFSLGTTLYEFLTLNRPFTGDSSHDITAKIVNEEPANPSTLIPSVAPDLVAILLKALEKNPADRYQTAGEFADDLRAFLEYRPIRARRRGAMSRATRWVKREPIKAGLATVLSIALALTVYVTVSQGATTAGYEALREQEIEDRLTRSFIVALDSRDSTTEFAQVLELDPGNPYAIIGGAWAIFGAKGAAEALTFVDQHRLPGRSDAALDRLRLRFQYDMEPDDSLLERLQSPANDATDCFVLGLIHRPIRHFHREIEKQTKQALAYFEDAILRSEKAQILHYIELAFVASRCDDVDVARRAADSLRALWPDSACARMAAGIALTWVDSTQAVTELELSTELDPTLLIAWRNLAVALAQHGDRERASEIYRHMIELGDENPQTFSMLAINLNKLGRHEEAVDFASRAVEITPDSALFRTQYAASLERVGDLDGAWREIEAAVQIAPRVDGPHRNLMGIARVRGMVDEMRKEAFRWVRVHPGGPTAHRELSEFLLEHGTSDRDREIALQAARNAVQLSAEACPYAWVQLARASHEHGLNDDVENALRSALMRMPEDEAERATVLERIELAQRELVDGDR